MFFHALILWLHLLGAVIWVGGVAFLALVVGPALARAASVREHLRLELHVERRFRVVMWPAVGVVLFTGLFNVINILYATSLSGGSMPPTFARLLALKMGLVMVMIILQAIDQLVVRPKRTRA
jgi:putative copper export protein